MFKGRMVALWVAILIVFTITIVDRYNDKANLNHEDSADIDLVVEPSLETSTVQDLFNQYNLQVKEEHTSFYMDTIVAEEVRQIEVEEGRVAKIEEEKRLAKIEEEKQEKQRLAQIEQDKKDEKQRLAQAEQEKEDEKVREQVVAKAEPKPQGASRGGGISRNTGSDTNVGGRDLGTFQSTSYCACSICTGSGGVGITASGTQVTANRTIAVDPNVIPLGSKVLIDGKQYIAEDTGSAVKGNIVDIFMESHQDALNWGRRNVNIKILD